MMTDYVELRRLAEAAKEWWRDCDWLDSEGPRSRYIAAASPDVVMGLLAERDEAKEAVKRLAGALREIQIEAKRTMRTEYARTSWYALADPVVRKIVGGG